MGGDHKCPVCQATFTRPQHVARHMRSHTGDRPYKCQYCGDQFARSDLLSRHVNKCHANEKPLPPAPGGRRKGPASASRATTSKQACDQCVQSSLPCDGCNPCAKCVQRKCRCTFVKFHRQTAPSGPGHTVPPTLSTSLTSALASTRPLVPPRYGYSAPGADDFVLGPPPQSAEMLFADNFSFPSQMYPGAVENDYQAKYRAQAELLRLPVNAGTGVTGMYSGSSSSSTASSNDPRWTAPVAGWQDGYHHSQHQQQQISLGHPAQHPNHGHHHHHHHHEKHPSDDLFNSSSSSTSGSTAANSTGLPVSFNAYRKSLESLDFGLGADQFRLTHGPYGADEFSSDGDGGSSVPSSATSSSVHLPLVPAAGEERPSSSYSNPAHGAHQQPPQPAATQQDFHNVFGMMSLDDPNVIAGIATDAEPFFSMPGAGTGDPDATPMPPSAATASKEDKEGEREMWKAFLRTPISGPNTSNSVIQQRGPRQRVASLPSVKTPGPAVDLSRTAHEDDLKSYEAAVMARKAPLDLKLQPKKRSGQPQHPLPRPQYQPGQVPIARFAQGAGVSSSSLAGVFGRPPPIAQLVPAVFPTQSAKSESPSSREPSLGTDDSASSGSPAGPASLPSSYTDSLAVNVKEEDGSRPSFKRLPSQTLGPAHAKRQFHGHADDDDERGWAYPDERDEEKKPIALNPPPVATTVPFAAISGSIAERRRRMSAPATEAQVGYAPVGQV